MQESAVKLVEKCLTDTASRAIRVACGRRQLGAGVPGGAQIALEAIRAATSHPDAEEVLSTDIKNAVGAVYKERVLRSCAKRCPQLLPYLLSSWRREGTLMYTQGPRGAWETNRSRRGIPQGGPLSDKLYAIAFEDILEDAKLDQIGARLCYADDLTFWSKRGGCAKAWPGLLEACKKGGLEMNIGKCHAWRPHAPNGASEVVPGVFGEPSLVILGSEMHDDQEVVLGAAGKISPLPNERRRHADLPLQL